MPLTHRLYIDNLPIEYIKDIPASKHRFIKPSGVFVGKYQCDLRYANARAAYADLGKFRARWRCKQNRNAPQLAVAHGKDSRHAADELELWRVFFDGILFPHAFTSNLVSVTDFDSFVNLSHTYANPAVLERSTVFPGCSKGYVDFTMKSDADQFLERFKYIFGDGRAPLLVKAVLQKGDERGDTRYVMHG